MRAARLHFGSVLVLCFIVLVFFPCLAYGVGKVSAAGGCSVPNSHPDAVGFYNSVKNFTGWTGNYYKKYGQCIPGQYQNASSGGNEHSWIDSSDIHYHVSHGGSEWDPGYNKWLTAIEFENGTYVPPSEALNSWGDRNIEWIAFRCCTLLNDASKPYWAKSMKGMHLFCGFKTNSSVADGFGSTWASLMQKEVWTFWPGISVTKPSLSVTQAWFKITDMTQPTGTTARVLAETLDCYNDHLHGMGYVVYPDPAADSVYWSWDHEVGGPAYWPVKGIRIVILYAVVPLTVTETYVQSIASAFGLGSERVAEACDSFVVQREYEPGKFEVLTVDKASGHYYFEDTGKLFVNVPGVGVFDPCEATDRVASFLSAADLLPGDAGPSRVGTEMISEEDGSRVIRTTAQNTSVAFGRELVADGRTMQELSVVGPGARLKVYMHEDGSVIGAMGNWRQVQEQGTVAVMDEAQALEVFNQYGNRFSLAPIYADYDSVQVNMENSGQAYYEFEGGKRQSLLIPVYAYDAQYFKNGQLVAKGPAFVPASLEYAPPICHIIEPPDGTHIGKGDPVTFAASVEAGLGTEPYHYLWESDVDGVLSTQDVFTTSSLSVNCPGRSCGCEPMPHVITLTVTDAHGLQSVDSISVTVDGECPDCVSCADLNNDGSVNFFDVSITGNEWLRTSSGD